MEAGPAERDLHGGVGLFQGMSPVLGARDEQPMQGGDEDSGVLFTRTPAVVNGFSDLILRLWGDPAGRHARSAVGQAALPFDIPVEIEAEVAIAG